MAHKEGRRVWPVELGDEVVQGVEMLATLMDSIDAHTKVMPAKTSRLALVRHLVGLGLVHVYTDEARLKRWCLLAGFSESESVERTAALMRFGLELASSVALGSLATPANKSAADDEKIPAQLEPPRSRVPSPVGKSVREIYTPAGSLEQLKEQQERDLERNPDGTVARNADGTLKRKRSRSRS